MGKHIVRPSSPADSCGFRRLHCGLLCLSGSPPGCSHLAAGRRGGGGTAEAAEHLRAELHLDKPVYQQYLIYTGELLTGDLGTSFLSGRPVTSEIIPAGPDHFGDHLHRYGRRLPYFRAHRSNLGRQAEHPVDHVTRVTTVVFLAVPNFWLATMVVVLPAIWWKYSRQ